MCGEQLQKRDLWDTMTGSPPRVRGTVVPQVVKRKKRGITPACAGNSRAEHRNGRRNWDHPRVCGEQLTPMILAAVPRGSPPRVRGTVDGLLPEAETLGITPACAGNSKHEKWSIESG